MLAAPYELVLNQSSSSFTAHTDIFKYFMADMTQEVSTSFSPLAVGTSGFFIRGEAGFTADNSCYQMNLIAIAYYGGLSVSESQDETNFTSVSDTVVTLLLA